MLLLVVYVLFFAIGVSLIGYITYLRRCRRSNILEENLKSKFHESHQNNYSLYHFLSQAEKVKMLDNDIAFDFDWQEYLVINKDAIEGIAINTEKEAINHFLSYGKQNLLCFKFDVKAYSALNKDLRNAGINTPQLLLDHFMKHGCKEGRKHYYKNLRMNETKI